jgi:HPr kinase/phosphorylase
MAAEREEPSTPQSDLPTRQVYHGSTVAFDGRAVMFIGASGSGKSSMALRMLALGARLVADDRSILIRDNGKLIASSPETISGRIEARGVGILAVDPLKEAELCLVVDMNVAESKRLPDPKDIEILGLRIPLLLRVDADYFCFAVMQFLETTTGSNHAI